MEITVDWSSLNYLTVATYISVGLMWLSGIIISAIFVYKKNTGNASALSFTTGLILSSIHLNVGIIQTDFLFLLVSALGCVLQTCYAILFLAYANKKTIPLIQFILAVITIIILNSVFWFNCLRCWTFEEKPSSTFMVIFQSLQMIFLLIFFGAPLTQMPLVVRTKKTESVSFSTIFFCITTSVLMFTRRYFIDGFYSLHLQIPYLIGIVLSVLQFVAFLTFFIIDKREKRKTYRHNLHSDYIRSNKRLLKNHF